MRGEVIFRTNSSTIGLKVETLEICIAAFRASDLTKCAPVGLSLEAWATILGMSTLAILGLIWRGVRLSFFGFTQFIAKTTLWTRNLIFGSNQYPEMCRAIWPLMEDNRRIFRSFGPSSGATAANVRFDQSLWVANRNKIVENNSKIGELIRSNFRNIPNKDGVSFERWLSHIDAFAAHVGDPNVDYREHQFPSEIVDLVSRHA